MKEECTSDYQIYRVCFIVIYALFFLSTIPILYKFMKQYQKSPSHVFYAGIAFIIFNILYYVSMIFNIANDCTEQSKALVGIKSVLWMVSYFAQSYFLLLLSYIRLNLVFKSTAFQLSKCTVFTYRTVFILIPLLLVIGVLFTIEILLVVIMFIFIMSFIATFIIFIRKTMTIYRMCGADESDLIELVTKLMILNNISISLTFLMPLFFVTYLLTSTRGVDSDSRTIDSILACLCTLLDAYSNLWCVMLTYSGFNKYYQTICGLMHGKCNSCCSKCVGVSDVTMLNKTIEKQVHSNSNSSIPNTISMQNISTSDIKTKSRNNTITNSPPPVSE